MPLPTPEQFLAKLAASPADAAAFDKFAGGKTRREAVEATLAAVTATITANAALKAQVVASKAKLASLEKARADLADLKAFQAKTGDRSLGGFLADRKSQPTSFMKTTPPPVKAPIAIATTSASAYASKPLLMSRSEFEKLTAQDKNRYMRDGGKLSA